MFVVGGSYKGFYLNELYKVGNVDLIIFNQKIFYEFDYEQEYLGNPIVSNELISLNNKFNCPIVVYGEYDFLGQKEICFILCVNKKVSVIRQSSNIYLFIKGKTFVISNEYRFYKNNFIKIFLVNKRCYDIDTIKHYNNCFICDKTGVFKLKNRKIYRKFRKYCYFIL